MNDIIKALEWLENQKGCCASDDEYIYGSIIQDIITRQKAEIERLQTEKDALIKTYKECQQEFLSEYVEKLKAESLEADVSYGYGRECWEDVVTVKTIEEKAKEMTGGEG